MRQKPGTKRSHGENVVKDIHRATRKQYSAEEKIIDTFSRYVPMRDARSSFDGEDVASPVDTVCRHIGYPKTIRVDDGSEFAPRGVSERPRVLRP